MIPDWRQIENENRGLFIESVRYLGEGWKSHAYLVNNELVFRFPKRLKQWEELKREIRFLSFAIDHLPLAAPRYLHEAPDSSAAPYGYAVYPYLNGDATDINVMSCEERAEAAESIATFLKALHGLQPDSDLGHLLPKKDERSIAERLVAQAELNIVPKLQPQEVRVLRQYFDQYRVMRENSPFRCAVRHADLTQNHVLMVDKSIVAVIDFGCVSWGDPDYDLMCPFVEFGEAFVEDVACRYGHTDLEQLMMKLRYFDIADLLDTIMNGPGYAPERQIDTAWIRLKQIINN